MIRVLFGGFDVRGTQASCGPTKSGLFRAAEGGDKVAVGVVERGAEGQAILARGGVESLGEGRGRELGVRFEKIGDDIVVFKMAERAGCVHEQAARTHVAGISGEDFALLLPMLNIPSHPAVRIKPAHRGTQAVGTFTTRVPPISHDTKANQGVIFNR